MGSTPSQTVEMDLNGTGALVNVTGWVDLQAGLEHVWGRTAENPFSTEPRPGTLTLTLENNDGRFTPGNTSVYIVGLVEGVLVQWTCGSRVRRFRTGVPEVSFPGGVGGRSTVTVTAYDALALLAKREMRQMVDEVAFYQQPAAYWPISESDSGATARAMDISGWAEAPLAPAAADPASLDLLSWGNGIGPRTDGRAALSMQPDATAPVDNAVSPYLTLTRALGTSGHDIDWYSSKSSLGTFGNQWGYGFSLWFSVRDIYGATFAAGPDDGPWVMVATVGGALIMWRLADRTMMINTDGNMTDVGTVQPGTMNHLFLWRHFEDVTAPSGNRIEYRFWLNGVESSDIWSINLASAPGAAAAPAVFIGADPNYGALGFNVYGLSGTVACASIYTDPQVDAMVTAGVIPDFYPVGSTGPEESSGNRFQRYGEWLGRAEIAYSVQGTPQATLCGPHDTGGEAMLSAMCAALALEERILDCATLSGVETVRAWMATEHRPTTPAVTVDVGGDGVGVPTLTFDASGVAVRVQAQGFTRTVTWLDPDAPPRWQGTSTSLDAATDDVDALRALAQFRSLLGRVTSMVPSKVTVDAVTSVASLTTALLDLRPMVRVRVSGLPSAIIGYAAVDAILVGCAERHSQGRSEFELQLTPDIPYAESVEDVARAGGIPENYSFTTPWTTGGHPITGQFPKWGIMSSSSTGVDLTIIGLGNPAGGGYDVTPFFFAVGALTDPVYVQIDDEIVRVDSASSIVTDTFTYATGIYAWLAVQTLTVTRAQLGTTAAAHSQSGGGIIKTSGTTMGPEAYTPPRAVFQHMFDACAF